MPSQISGCQWTVPVFKGFDNDRFQQHDADILRVAVDFHYNPSKYSGGGNNLPTDVSAAVIKAWAIQESGGNSNAWGSDPMQVNVPGDWDKNKSLIGLQRPSSRNEGSPDQNIDAAVMWLTRKGYGASGQPMSNRPDGTFDGWRTALERYNGRNALTTNKSMYKENYADRIMQRADNPDETVPIPLPQPERE
jgi:hypothetical protein